MEHKTYSRKPSKKQKAIKMLQKYKNADGTQKETSIEKVIRLYLDSIGVYYQQEYPVEYKGHHKYYDFYVTNGLTGFWIEANGDYFHKNPNIQNGRSNKKITKMQRKNMINDQLKMKIAKERGIPLLIFWEEEIKNKLEYVQTTIKEECKRHSIVFIE